MKDLFILHADADRAFTRAYLVPALGFDVERDRDRLLLSSELPLGMSVAQAIEAGVATSRVTVAVVTPAFLNDGWSAYGETLAGHHAIGGGLLVPLLLADCALPLRLDFRVKLDCRDESRRADEVRRLRALLELPTPPAREIPCPYPGLRPYAAENAALFCGRDGEVDDLVSRIAGGCRELYVVGPSGSGKSSLLLSGVVPRLGGASPVVGEAFAVRVLRPGETPTERLAAAIASFDPLAPAPDGATAPRRLVVIDQLEEVFTLASKGARRDFLMALDEVRKAPGCHLALVVRADFLGALMSSELWPHVRRSHRHEVDPLRGDALRAAITLPARRVGVELEPGLLDRLLDDAASEPGSLPLIQEALVHLWAKRDANLLTEASYVELGGGATSGLAAALARRADTALADLDDAGQALARRLFLRLVSFGEGRADTRRQQPLAALRAGVDDTRVDVTARHLIERRLLTADGDETSGETLVDLAHETLIVSWAKLRSWIAAYRKDEQRRRKLEDKAAEWAGRAAQGHRTVGLLDAGQLAELHGWLTADTTRDLGLSADLETFVAASQAAVDAQLATERARQRRWRRGVTVALVGLATAVVAVSTLAVFAGQRSRAARAHAAEARRQLARNYMVQGQALVLKGRGREAAPYLLAAREAGLDDGALATLFRWATQYWPRLILGHQDRVLALSPDGTRVATVTDHDRTQVWDARTAEPVATLETDAGVFALAWSPDGARAVTVGVVTRVWDARGWQPVATLGHPGGVVAVAWSPDGTRVATAGVDHTVRVWEAETGEPMRTLEHGDTVGALAWSPDGTRVATASDDDTARVWGAVTGELMWTLQHQGDVNAVAWSPDGKALATASDDRTAQLWDASTGKELPPPPLAHPDEVNDVAGSPDGTALATGSDDRTAELRDASTGKELPPPPLADPDEVNDVAWSPDGTALATASDDRTAELRDASKGKELPLPPLAHPDKVNDVAWSPDGTWLVTDCHDGIARAWDATTREPTALVDAPIRWDGALSPDGTRVATGGFDLTTGHAVGTARVWDARTGQPLSPPLEHQDSVLAVVWGPDGRWLATASIDGTVRLWDTPLSLPPADDRAARAPWLDFLGAWSNFMGFMGYMSALSPDGSRVVTVGDGEAQVSDVGTELPVATLGKEDMVRSVAWSPNGRWLATAGLGTARIWDAWFWLQAAEPLEHGLIYTVLAVAWSPDGTRVATASANNSARVWDARTGDPLTLPLEHLGTVYAVAWSPDGTQVATASEDKSARVWDARTGDPLTPPLEHAVELRAVTWSPDGTRIVTTDVDDTARSWDVSDRGSIDDWRATVRRGPFELKDGVAVARDPEDRVLSTP